MQGLQTESEARRGDNRRKCDITINNLHQHWYFWRTLWIMAYLSAWWAKSIIIASWPVDGHGMTREARGQSKEVLCENNNLRYPGHPSPSCLSGPQYLPPVLEPMNRWQLFSSVALCCTVVFRTFVVCSFGFVLDPLLCYPPRYVLTLTWPIYLPTSISVFPERVHVVMAFHIIFAPFSRSPWPSFSFLFLLLNFINLCL